MSEIVGEGDGDPGVRRGRVLETVGGVYRVDLEGVGQVDASLRGRLKKVVSPEERIVAGDWVRVSDPGGEGEGVVVEERLPRDNELVRGGPGGRKPKVVAANLDRVVVVLSVVDPSFRPEIADRFLVLVESCGITPILVLNKMDLPGAPEAVSGPASLYRSIGYQVCPTSARTGEGLQSLLEILGAGTSALIGPSGVGKSSLLNALDPGLELRTAPVSRRRGRGRHTTVSARLLPLSSGWVVDTPGFSDVTLWGVDPATVVHSFPEFFGPGESCRFSGCTHTHEPGCGVKEALGEGQIPESRYASYLTIAGVEGD